MEHSWFAACPRCGAVERKSRMRPLYTADGSSLPPHLMGYLCESCFADLLEWADLADVRAGARV